MDTTVLHPKKKTTQELIQESLLKAMPYTEYRLFVEQLAKEGRSSGPKQTEARANYTLLNDRRMRRFDKIIKFDTETISKIKSIDKKITMLVLTESWCGDAAPSMPVMNKIAELNGNIDFKVILRDENLDLMHRFLTDGALSIPKLLFVEDNTMKVFAEWGPRPSTATEMATDYKAEHGNLTPEFKEDLQLWYNKDKGQDILNDLLRLLP